MAPFKHLSNSWQQPVYKCLYGRGPVWQGGRCGWGPVWPGWGPEWWGPVLMGAGVDRNRVAHACGSRCIRGCKHRAPLWCTENIRLPMWILSIAISIIDLNVHRWSTKKLIMLVNSHESRSVASDGLTKCIQAMVSLNIYKNSANKFGRKNPLFKSNLTLKV